MEAVRGSSLEVSAGTGWDSRWSWSSPRPRAFVDGAPSGCRSVVGGTGRAPNGGPWAQGGRGRPGSSG